MEGNTLMLNSTKFVAIEGMCQFCDLAQRTRLLELVGDIQVRVIVAGNCEVWGRPGASLYADPHKLVVKQLKGQLFSFLRPGLRSKPAMLLNNQDAAPRNKAEFAAGATTKMALNCNLVACAANTASAEKYAVEQGHAHHKGSLTEVIL